jgi:hypothetical protein
MVGRAPHGGGEIAPAGHNEGTSLRKTPDTMRSVEMRKRRSDMLPKTCRRAEDALPYSTLN